MEFLKNFGVKILGIVLIISAIIFGYNRYNEVVEQNLIREQKIESLEKEINIRRKVDGILQESREANPNRDGSIALDRLREQYPDSN